MDNVPGPMSKLLGKMLELCWDDTFGLVRGIPISSYRQPCSYKLPYNVWVYMSRCSICIKIVSLLATVLVSSTLEGVTQGRTCTGSATQL
jgi:hypothetical protein